MKNPRPLSKPVEDYWYHFYCVDHCTLCGNHGVIDSRGVKTPAGYEVGRLNWCICPNGQKLREQISGLPTEFPLRRSGDA